MSVKVNRAKKARLSSDTPSVPLGSGSKDTFPFEKTAAKKPTGGRSFFGSPNGAGWSKPDGFPFEGTISNMEQRAQLDKNPDFQERDRRASAQARRQSFDTYHRQSREAQQDVGEEQSQKSFSDYLAEALGMVGGASVNYDPQRDAARSHAAQGDASIAQAYLALQQQFAGQQPAIAQAFAGAQGDVGANAQQASTNLAQSGSAIQSEQARLLSALGIQEAAPATLAGKAEDQSFANGQIQQDANIVQNQLATNGATAQNFNTQLGAGASAEGASKRAQLQMSLMQQLAEIDAQEQQDNASMSSQRQSSALSLAQQLMGQDADRESGVAASAQQQFENDLQAAKFGLEQQQFDAQQSKVQTVKPTLQDYVNMIQQIQKGSNWGDLNPTDFSKLLSAVK